MIRLHFDAAHHPSDNRPALDNLNNIYYYHGPEENCLKVPTIQKNLLFKNEPLKIIAVIALTSLTLSLLAGLLATSGINALPSRGGGGQLGAGSLSGIQTNGGGGIDRGSLQVGDSMSGIHPDGGDPLSGLNRPANCGNLPTSTTPCFS